MARKRRPLARQDTDHGPLPDCGPCLDHLFTPLLTARYVEHYHASGHKEAL